MFNHNSLLLLDISMSMHTSLDDIDRINKTYIYIYLDWAPKRKTKKNTHKKMKWKEERKAEKR